MSDWLRTFAGVVIVESGRSPRLLNKASATTFALVTTSVVLATTDQTHRIVGVGQVATVRVTIAHTPTADRYVLD